MSGCLREAELDDVSSVSTVKQVQKAAKQQLPNVFAHYDAAEIQVHKVDSQLSIDRVRVLNADGQVADDADINAAVSTLQRQPPLEPGSLLLFVSPRTAILAQGKRIC